MVKESANKFSCLKSPLKTAIEPVLIQKNHPAGLIDDA